MAAYDFRASPDGPKRLTEGTAAALVDALRAQRAAGKAPVPALQQAITAAATEARESGMRPESLIIHLKQLAEEAGIPAALGDDKASSIREWLVRACIEAYYG